MLSLGGCYDCAEPHPCYKSCQLNRYRMLNRYQGTDQALIEADKQFFHRIYIWPIHPYFAYRRALIVSKKKTRTFAQLSALVIMPFTFSIISFELSDTFLDVFSIMTCEVT